MHARQPAGTPAGGQFAATGRTEAVVSLTPPVPDVVAAAVPRDRTPMHQGYYAQTDAKHFGTGTSGSTFTDPALRRVEDVLTLALHQRGTLAGDDRDELIAAGSDPAGFRDGMRYLKVDTPGVVGVTHTAGLPDSTPVHVVRDKDGVPCSPVLDVDTQPTTDTGVVLVAADKDTGDDLVLTCFPGPVTAPPYADALDELEGQTVTLGRVRGILGGDFHAQTRVA